MINLTQMQTFDKKYLEQELEQAVFLLRVQVIGFFDHDLTKWH